MAVFKKKKNLFWKKKQKKKLIKWCNELKINRKKNLLPLNTIWELYVIVTYAHVCEKNFIFREIWWKILSDNFFDENRKRIYYWAYDLFKWGMWSLIMRVQDLFRKKKKNVEGIIQWNVYLLLIERETSCCLRKHINSILWHHTIFYL